ncbi:hypothetical protein HMPREF9056_00127 [Actinomyces sp. oral taxon 170 str. F0386]|nr:hypothetical protein HMPREF9056_00127 [Actinomyces sp. oral taxon 170 str. F0386]
MLEQPHLLDRADVPGRGVGDGVGGLAYTICLMPSNADLTPWTLTVVLSEKGTDMEVMSS